MLSLVQTQNTLTNSLHNAQLFKDQFVHFLKLYIKLLHIKKKKKKKMDGLVAENWRMSYKKLMAS